ncbi:MAG TPA: hypothetical protein VKR06_46430 [Ktedonosporobacter sp.]|nr:hypothetical protein [Ktedonosporobacter sp.]
MLQQAPISTTIRRHIDTLRSSDLDALLDRHIFGREPRCRGNCEFQVMIGSQSYHRCEICGGIEERSPAQRYFGADGHERLIPRYTVDKTSIQCVIDAIGRMSKTIQSCYTLNICCYCPVGASMTVWLNFGPTPRQIALAALRAVDVVDSEGYVETV